MTEETTYSLKIFKVAVKPAKYAIFTWSGDYLETVSYNEARPLILRPEARRNFLAAHGLEPA